MKNLAIATGMSISALFGRATPSLASKEVVVVVTTCAARLDDLLVCRLDGPMIHYPEERRKSLCKNVGIPWVRHLHTLDHPCLDVTKFRPDKLDTQSTHNCVCSALSAVLSGTPAHANISEDVVRPDRTGPAGHLTVRFDGDLLEGGVDDLLSVIATDTKSLARRLGVKIYEYYIGRGDSPPGWITYSGNHRGPADGGIYLAVRWLRSRRLFHCRRHGLKTLVNCSRLPAYFSWAIAALVS